MPAVVLKRQQPFWNKRFLCIVWQRSMAMFNTESVWVLMAQHRRLLVQQACSWRLQREANRDHVWFVSRMLGSVGALLIDLGTTLKERCWKLPERPHEFVTPPQDRVYA
jgi:hypothetical protein